MNHTPPERVPFSAVAIEPRAPLWATSGLTWVNNVGASVALMGVYFIAFTAYQFTDTQRLLLGLLQGATYIGGALTAGPVGRMLAGPNRAFSTRALTGLVMVAMGLMCWLPVAWRSEWSIWIMVGVYSALSGWLWPLIESFLASGRTGAELRHGIGTFNFSWSSCQFITFWVLPAFMPDLKSDEVATAAQITTALWSMPLLGLSHVVALVFLWKMPREPGHHAEAGDDSLSPEQRERYRRLLTAHRWMLIMAYVGFSATNPLLPQRIDSLGISSQWATAFTSIWMLARVASFTFMGRWHGWQGRRRTLIWSPALLLLGITGMLVAPDRWSMAVALVLFGIGHGAVYTAAIYYALEVGSGGVDAGGKHEALIGCGYSIGPVAALLAASGAAGAAASQSGTESGASGVLLASIIVALAAGAGVLSWRAVRAGERRWQSRSDEGRERR
ncbi:MAG: MFS transporter [Phycisphaerales bacterium]